jgi:hypothetical protein
MRRLFRRNANRRCRVGCGYLARAVATYSWRTPTGIISAAEAQARLPELIHELTPGARVGHYRTSVTRGEDSAGCRVEMPAIGNHEGFGSLHGNRL